MAAPMWVSTSAIFSMLLGSCRRGVPSPPTQHKSILPQETGTGPVLKSNMCFDVAYQMAARHIKRCRPVQVPYQ